MKPRSNLKGYSAKEEVCLDGCFHSFQLFDTSHIELKPEKTADKSTIHAKTGSADETENSSNMK